MSACKTTVVPSPMVLDIFDLNVCMNKNCKAFEKEYNIDTCVLSPEIRDKLGNSIGEFYGDSFGSNDTFDDLFELDNNTDEANQSDIYNKVCTDVASAKFEKVTVVVRKSSLLVRGNEFKLPESIVSCDQLPGLKVSSPEGSKVFEDSLILCTRSGYLILVRLCFITGFFQPVVFQYVKIADGCDKLSFRLGAQVSCSRLGNFFVVSAIERYAAIFPCQYSYKGIYFENAKNFWVPGMFISASILDYNGFASDSIDVVSTYFNETGVIFMKLMEFAPQSQTCYTLPISVEIGLPLFVVPFGPRNALLVITKESLFLIKTQQVHNADTRFVQKEIPGGIISYHYPLDDPNKLYLATKCGAIFSIEIDDSDTITSSIVFETSHIFSSFTITKCGSDRYHLSFCDERTDGYKLLVSADGSFKRIKILESFPNWGMLRDVKCLPQKKVSTNITSDELWVCSGVNNVGALTQLRHGLQFLKQEFYKEFVSAINVFVLSSTIDGEVWFYFMCSFDNCTKIFALQNTELNELPFAPGLSLDSETILAFGGQDYIVQVTQSKIILGNINETFQEFELTNSAVMAVASDSMFCVVCEDLTVNCYTLQLKPLVSFTLSAAPNCVKIISEDCIVFGTQSGTLEIFKVSSKKWTSRDMSKYSISAVHDFLMDISDPERILVFVSDYVGSFVSFYADSSFNVFQHQIVNLCSTPIKFCCHMGDIYLTTKCLWKLASFSDLARSPDVIPVYFQDPSLDRNIFEVCSVGEKLGLLCENGLYLGQPNQVPGTVPFSFPIKSTPLRIMYISYIHCYCVLVKDTESRVMFFDKKNYRFMKVVESMKSDSKKKIFSSQEVLHCCCEWTLRKSNGVSSYKNLVIGSQLGDTGLVHIFEVKRDKTRKDVIKLTNLYSWKTQGRLVAIGQITSANTLVYAFGREVFTRKYRLEAKSLEIPVLQCTCDSDIVMMEVSDDGTSIMISTKLSSVTILHYDCTSDKYVKKHVDPVSRYLADSVFACEDKVVLSDKLHSSISGYELTDSLGLKQTFKINLEGIHRLRHNSFNPVWSPEKFCTVLYIDMDGEVGALFLLSDTQYEDLKMSMEKKQLAKFGSSSKGFWEFSQVKEFLEYTYSSNVIDLDNSLYHGDRFRKCFML